jgi:uncharacterized protein
MMRIRAERSGCATVRRAVPTRAPADPEAPTARRALLAALATTVAVTAVSRGLPASFAATGVGLAFFAAAGWLVLRHDCPTIQHYGLSLGGLFEPRAIGWRDALGSAKTAIFWALGFALVVFPVFFIGFRIYWHVRAPFVLRLPSSVADEVLGQLLVVALPEEAFFRGYLQTALDDAWGARVQILGARVGWGLVVSAAIFAAGHVLTEPYPARLAVFFPALLFGWLRARTGGIGASLTFHALCNLVASLLVRGYGLGL